MADEQTNQEPAPEETERKARDMGWQPKEQWKGNPDNWVDAPEFLKRGETFVPFLQHDRKKLRDELGSLSQRFAQTSEELRQTRETLESLKTFNEEMAKERTDRRKAELGVALKAAREAGDDVKVAELQAELGEVVKKPEVKPEVKPGNGAGPTQPQIQPWVKNFIDSNADFFQSTRKVALFNAIMLERRQGGDTRVGEVEGTALLNEAREEVEKSLGGNQRRQAPSKTEESRSSGGGGSSGGAGGKTYADLDAEARAKCDAQESRFVGKEGKAFKTQAEWRSHFVREYFA